MKTKEIRMKTSEELQKMLFDLKKEAFNMRFQRASGNMPNTSRIGEVRKSVAKINTVLNERKLKLEVANA